MHYLTPFEAFPAHAINPLYISWSHFTSHLSHTDSLLYILISIAASNDINNHPQQP